MVCGVVFWLVVWYGVWLVVGFHSFCCVGLRGGLVEVLLLLAGLALGKSLPVDRVLCR